MTVSIDLKNNTHLCYHIIVVEIAISFNRMSEHPLVLIVDDEAAFREIFGAKLLANGFRVETAENGELGVAKAKAIKPDLILMDVKMPVLDGPDALLKLREDPETQNIKVVFITGLGDPTDHVQEINKKFSKEFGAQGYIRKSDDVNGLTDKVLAFLEHERNAGIDAV